MDTALPGSVTQSTAEPPTPGADGNDGVRHALSGAHMHRAQIEAAEQRGYARAMAEVRDMAREIEAVLDPEHDSDDVTREWGQLESLAGQLLRLTEPKP